MAGEREYVIEALAVPETIADLHELLARVGRENSDVSDMDLMMFETAVIEIAANVVEHGRPEGQVFYTFRLLLLDDRIEAALSDSGEELYGQPLAASLPDEMAERGRGLALADAVLDELVYERCQERNTWKMIKLRS
jgi:serine/threonine-protein kinase RsbW